MSIVSRDEKKKIVADLKQYFLTTQKLHIDNKVYVEMEDIMWVLDTLIKEK